MEQQKKKQAPIETRIAPKKSAEQIAQHKPQSKWRSIDQCMNVLIKDLKPIHVKSFKAHIKALKIDNKPDRWEEALKNFGFKLNK